jgi:hypothetical protein
MSSQRRISRNVFVPYHLMLVGGGEIVVVYILAYSENFMK